MKDGKTDHLEDSKLSLRQCIAAWMVALSLIAATVVSSLVATLFENWI